MADTQRGFWSRLNPFYRNTPNTETEDRERAWAYESGRIDLTKLLLADSGNALSRRFGRSNADIAATSSAVYSAIRKRSVSITKPNIKIVRDMQNGEVLELTQHPALKALRRMNSGLTFKQGISLIEQMKLTYGECFLLKRVNAQGKTEEFAFISPDCVTVIPDADMPWVAAKYQVEDRATGKAYVVQLRHMVDVRSPLRGLSPINAARTAIDTGYEAQRFTARYFDQGSHPGTLYTLDDASPAEAQRVGQMIETNMKGTDGAWRSMVVDGGLKQVSPSISNRDMDYINQLNWGLEEVARAFELNPTVIGSGNSTFSNVEAGDTGFWEMITTALEFTLDELTEWFLVPEYGAEFRFVVDTSNVPALQGDKKLAAEIDNLRLQSGVVTINEIRTRDGLDGVEWGNRPLVNAGVTSLGEPYQAPQLPAPKEDRALEAEFSVIDDTTEVRAGKPLSVKAQQELIEAGWARRLGKQRSALITHIKKGSE